VSNNEAIKKIEEYQPLIRKVSFMYGQNSAEADDMFQEICIQAWRAFDEAAAEEKFNTWMADKASKVQAKVDSLNAAKSSDSSARFEAEKKINDERAQAIAAKSAELVKEAEDAAKAEAAEADAEVAAKEAAKAPVEEAPAAEAKETVAPEAKTEETPAAEEAKDAPAEEKAE